MNNSRFEVRPNLLRRAGLRLMQAAALALIMTLAMPARADERAVKSKASLIYPEIAKRMRISGAVRLSVTVDLDGKVTGVQPLSGNGMLSTAAEESVRKWRFAPGPGATTLEVVVNFALP
jgi:TonB family protein